MKRTRFLGAAGLFAALLAGRGEAQEGGVTVRAGRVTDERGAAHGALSVASSLRWARPGSALTLGVQGTLLDGAGVLGGADAAGAVVVAEAAGAALVLAGTGSAQESTAGYRGLAGRFSPRLVVGGAGWGAAGGPFLGGGGERVERMAGGGWPLLPAQRSGRMEWRGVWGASAEGWLEGGAGALRARWTDARSGGAAWRDVAGGATLRSGVVKLGAEMGVRLAEEGELWAAASAAVNLGGGTSLIAEVGRHPSDPLTGRAAGRFASVGVGFNLGEGTQEP